MLRKKGFSLLFLRRSRLGDLGVLGGKNPKFIQKSELKLWVIACGNGHEKKFRNETVVLNKTTKTENNITTFQKEEPLMSAIPNALLGYHMMPHYVIPLAPSIASVGLGTASLVMDTTFCDPCPATKTAYIALGIFFALGGLCYLGIVDQCAARDYTANPIITTAITWAKRGTVIVASFGLGLNLFSAVVTNRTR